MPDELDITKVGKGALPDPPDERDFKAEQVMGAVNVDWSKEFRLPEPPNSDQAQSLRCVGEAWSYYHWQLKRKRFSPKDIYSKIFLPEGGAYLRDGGKILTSEGQQTLQECPDPSPMTEAKNRIRCANPDKAKDDIEANYFSLPQQDINGVAWGIQNYKGVVFGVSGSNNGWRDMKYPKPPSYGEPGVWGHALYGMGFHICTDGQKCIIAKSSWGSLVNEHHIRENYFITGNTFSAWTLIPKEELTNMKLVRDKGTIYLVAGVNQKVKTGIASQEVLTTLFGDEPIIDGDTSDIPQSQTASTGFVIHKK